MALTPVSGASGVAAPRVAPRSGVVLTSHGGRVIAVNADGSGIQELTHPPTAADNAPVASPDGAAIAFARFSKPAGIYVMNADGSGVRRVGPGNLYGPAWSADGHWLAAATYDAVYVMKADGTSVRHVGTGNSPTWSPDGQWLAYKGANAQSVHLVRLDGTRTLKLSTPISVTPDFAWSPDGGSLAYANRAGLAFLDVTSGQSHQIVRRRELGRGISVERLSWSPDGSRIAFQGVGDEGTSYHVYVATFDESPAHRVGPESSGLGVPVWSPDGTRVAYSSEVGFDPPTGIVVVDADTGRTVWKLPTIAGGGSENPSWSPDGKELVFERENLTSPTSLEYVDLWVVDASGDGATQLTEAFPFEGVDSDPTSTWWRGRTTVAPDPPLQTVGFQTAAKRRASNPFGIAGADGNRLAVWGYYSGLRVSYDGGRGAWKRARGGGDSVAFSGKRLYFASNDREESYLFTAAGPRSRARTLRSSGGDQAGQHFTVASDRSLVAFTVGRWLWRVRGTRTRRIRYERSHLDLADIDGGRILLLRTDGRLELVNPKGRLLRSFSSPGDRIQDGRLSGRRVVGVGTRRILVFDARTGHLRATWRVGAPGVPPSAAGFISKSLLPYADGSALHVLDVDTGHDLIVQIPGVTEPVDGAVTNQGLLYTWTATYSKWQGRLGLVPLPALKAALATAPPAP